MKTSREQFEEWYSNRYGIPDFSKAFENAKRADAFEVWQASRQCIEVELPEPFTCYQVETGKLYYDAEVVSAMSNAGIKVKGA